jgi:hypothetical protein
MCESATDDSSRGSACGSRVVDVANHVNRALDAEVANHRVIPRDGEQPRVRVLARDVHAANHESATVKDARERIRLTPERNPRLVPQVNIVHEMVSTPERRRGVADCLQLCPRPDDSRACGQIFREDCRLGGLNHLRSKSRDGCNHHRNREKC